MIDKDMAELRETVQHAVNAQEHPHVQRSLLLDCITVLQRMIDTIDTELIRAGRMPDDNANEYGAGDRLYMRGTRKLVVIDAVRTGNDGKKTYKPLGSEMFYPASFFERSTVQHHKSLLEGDGC